MLVVTFPEKKIQGIGITLYNFSVINKLKLIVINSDLKIETIFTKLKNKSIK